jgi:hypothetical protein
LRNLRGALYRLIGVDDVACPDDVRPMTALAAVFNLNHPSHLVHWHFFQMSVSNIVVIVLMLVVFVLAILLPFPGTARRRGRG